MTGLQGAYPYYVVWNAPNQPNGVITGYRLTFTQDDVTETVDTDNDQTLLNRIHGPQDQLL